MKNKVLIKLIVLELDETFDLFIPVNEIVWKLKKLILKSVSDLSGLPFDNSMDCLLINKDNSQIYQDNDIIIDTQIRNGTELLLKFK